MRHEQVSGVLTATQRALLIGFPLMIMLAFSGAYSVFKIKGSHQPVSSSAAQAPQPIFTSPIPVVTPMAQTPLSLVAPLETTSGISVISSSDTTLNSLLHEGALTDPQTAAATANLQNANDDTGQNAGTSSTKKKIDRQSGDLGAKKINVKTYLEELKDDLGF